MLSKSNLIRRTLEKMAVYAPGESIAAHDQNSAALAYDAIYGELSDQGYVAWPNTGLHTEEIPDKYARPLTEIMAADLGPYFGKPEFDSLGERGYRALFRLVVNDYEPHPIPTKFL